mmetsp:Transcript_107778/g.300405  ORF Transcript_107778/g.300405 Transcript_107778/m.300405 type:complete len:226 (+) Transcript_107778:1906-2583(+)
MGAMSCRITRRTWITAPRSMTFHAQPRPGSTCTPSWSVTEGAVLTSWQSSAGGGPAQALKVPSPVSGFVKTRLKYMSRLVSFTYQMAPPTPRKTSSHVKSSRDMLLFVRLATGCADHRPESHHSPSNTNVSSERLSISTMMRLSTSVVREVSPAPTPSSSASVDLHQRAFSSRRPNSSGIRTLASTGRMMQRTVVCSSCRSSVSHAQPSARRRPAPGRARSGTRS